MIKDRNLRELAAFAAAREPGRGAHVRNGGLPGTRRLPPPVENIFNRGELVKGIIMSTVALSVVAEILT